MSMNRRFLLSAVAVSAAGMSLAVIRLDTTNFPLATDAAYLANAAQFPAVGKLTNNGTFGATLINDEWIITAGHVLASGINGTVTIGNTVYTITATRHPSYASNNITNGFDVCLAKLSARVLDVKPVSLYTGAWVNQPVWMVGWGLTGTGLVGNQGGAGAKRAGTNILESIGDYPNIAFTDFDNGASANNFLGSSTPTQFEGQMAGGDSGGAWMVQDGTEFKILAVNSFVARFDNLTTYSFYGALSGATRLTPVQTWINNTINAGSAGKVSGKVTVASLTGSYLGQSVQVTLKDAAGASLGGSFSVPLAFDGSYSFTTPQRGNLQVGLKSSTGLRAYLGSVNVTNSWTQNQNITLSNGDCNNDNVIDLTDYTIIAVAFNALLDTDPVATGNQSSANWNSTADLNVDGVVDLTDYTIVATGFNQIGAP
jgi:hypothetical protein